MAVNTVFLNRPVDEKVSAERVGETGFPLAVERMVREKFPDLPLDHPAAALLLSGANLAMLVASCRGKLEPKQEPERAPSQAEAEPSPEPSPAPRAVPSGSTGDPYWDAILAKAGGVAT
jgi:hypothetical protein